VKATILTGNVLARIKEIPDETVQCVVTSPPYWGLRDYGHEGQLGLEPTPEAYVENMVAVFREVRRILKDDGVLWLNLGDSYCGYKGENYLKNPETSKLQSKTTVPSSHSIGTPQTSGLKPKDLVGIPWRVAFALQADGWWLRQDIIWHKPNPMPESVTDRCTKAHEYLFMLTKSGRYYFDNQAIKEPLAEESVGRKKRQENLVERTGLGTLGKQIERGVDPKHGYAGLALARNGKTGYSEDGLRNKRSVWTIPTKPFRGAHFAVMPEALCEPPILASTSRHGQCRSCGANWVRVMEEGEIAPRRTRDNTLGVIPGRNRTSRLQSVDMEAKPRTTIGWEPSCECDCTDTEPNVVFDPFTGSGTVAVVAMRLGMNYLGVELNEEYVEIAKKRICDESPMFNEVEIIKQEETQ
jgi:DNA modification methylase